MRFREGQLIAGRYQVDQLAGTGSGAEVYKVWDSQRSTFLALKLFRSELKQFPELINRFQDEAVALSRLQHPNIVRFYELVQKDDLIFFLMDFIEGHTLRQEIRQKNSPFDIDSILKILQPICAALQYAHHNQIIHCDVKPENILIDQKGIVLLTDYGIAELTGSNIVIDGGIGTPAYMAPEQIAGRKISPQTDQYALGVIVYELLTGVKPFTGQDAPSGLSNSDRIRWEHLNLYPIPPNQVNPALKTSINAIVLKCLHKDPGQRYTNVHEFLKDFETQTYKPIVTSTAVTTGEMPVVKKKILARHKMGKSLKIFIPIMGTISIILLIMVFSLGVDDSRNGKPTLQATEYSTGTYSFPMACMDIVIKVQPKTDLNECVSSISVQPDGKLQVNLVWKVTSTSDVVGVIVHPDTDNHNMYLLDDSGKRLHHIATGGGTDQEVELFDGQQKEGWFIFPAPDPSATYFYFVDEDNNVRSPRLERKWH